MARSSTDAHADGAARSPRRPGFFDTAAPGAGPTSPFVLVPYLAFASLAFFALANGHVMVVVMSLITLIGGLTWAPADAWTNVTAWEDRWAASAIARWQQRAQAAARRWLGQATRYAVVLSAAAIVTIAVGLVVDLPALLVFAAIGGVLFTLVGTLPLCIATGLVSGALLPTSWHDDEPVRVRALAEALQDPAVRAHVGCVGLGVFLLGVAVTLATSAF